MVALKGSGIENFLRGPDRNVRAALFYGPDTGLVAELARRLVLTRVGDADDPFNVSRLEDSDLAGDPGRLVDEACAQSLMGGERVVWVRAAGAGSAAALESYLKDPSGEAVIVIEAGELKPSARLRKAAEKSRQAVSIACYADSGRTIEELVDAEMAKADLSITPDARQTLISMLGADRQVTRRELEKLALYVNGKQKIDVEDVEAVCGDAGAATMDSIIDAAAEGRIDLFDGSYQTAIASGFSATGILLACSRHMTRLQLMSLSANPDAAMKSARPPIHFSRQLSVRRQLRLWSAEGIARAIAYLAETESQTRTHGDLGDVLVSRALMSLARKANALERKRP